jgi:hypothetical protein
MKEDAVIYKLAAIFASNRDEVSVPKIYIDMTGDYEAAAVLDEIFFWTLPKKNTGKTSLKVRHNGKLWLAVRRSEWWDRKRLTERQADRAIQKLIDLDFVEKDVVPFNGKPTTHLRLKVENFVKPYAEKLMEIVQEEQETNENLVGDIADLYAMMGFSISPNGDGILPNGDSPSPNGDFLNSLHDNQQTQPNDFPAKTDEERPEYKLSEQDIQFANKKVDAILGLAKKSTKYWKGRELFRDNHVAFADWWHNQTNQVCMKRSIGSWQKAFLAWQNENLSIEHLQEAYNQDIIWRKVFTDPNELTKKAVAIKALRDKQEESKPEVRIDSSGIPMSY